MSDQPRLSKRLLPYLLLCLTQALFLTSLSWSQEGSWQLLGFGGQEVEQVVVDPIDDNILYAGLWQEEDTTAIYKSYDGGLTWQPLPVRQRRVTSIAIDPVNNENIYVGFNSARPLRSKDGGISWTEMPIPQGFGNTYFSIDPFHNNIVYSNIDPTESVLTLKSTDYGLSWQNISPEFTSGSRSTPVAIHPQNSDILYTKAYRLNKSTDQGQTWEVVSYDIQSIGYILINSHCPDTVYIFSADKFYASYDEADTWQLPITLPYKVWQAVVSPKDKNIIYAAGWTTVVNGIGGVLRTLDGGLNWEDLSLGLPQANVWSVAVTSDGTILYASSDSGLFRYEGVTSVHENENSIRQDFKLSQNYPNPFSVEANSILFGRRTTSIRYQIKNEIPLPVSLSIFDVLGRRIKHIQLGMQVSGTYEISWDGKGQLGHEVASGIYIYQLKVGQQKLSKKMLLLH